MFVGILDKLQSLSYGRVEQRYDFMSFNLEKLCSPLAILTSIESIGVNLDEKLWAQPVYLSFSLW